MDGVLHQLAECLVNQAMAGDGGLAGKARRDDGNAPVRLPARPCAGMAGVLRALVDEVEGERFEGCEPLANALLDVQGLSSSTCLARNSDCATTKSNISPMPPKSLNDAQTFSE